MRVNMDGNDFFSKGKYASCLELQQQQLQESGITLSKQLSLLNNATVCKTLLGQVERSAGQKELQEVLDKCRTVVRDRSVLCVELTVLYNYIYLHSVDETRLKQGSMDLHQMYKLAAPTLLKVYRLADPADYPAVKGRLPRDHQACCHYLMEKCSCLLALGAGTDEILRPLTLSCCLLVIGEMRADNLQTATTCLTWLKSALSSAATSTAVQTSYSDHGLMFTLGLGRLDSADTQTPQGVENLVYLLLAVAHYHSQQWQQCSHSLQHINPPDWSPCIPFIRGLCGYRDGDYSTAVEHLATVSGRDTVMVPRLKARILNLTGSCYVKLEKPELAIQMFKESLLADFGFLFPLYNISQLYGKQGASNEEMECLTLLVTALESTSDVRPHKPECCIDVLDLVEAGDQNVAYPLALYTLASCCLRQNKYDRAVMKYVDLLAYLTDATHQFKAEDMEGLSELPPLLEVYQEAVAAMLGSGEWQHCVSLCDRILAHCPGPQSPGLDVTQDSGTSLDTSTLSPVPGVGGRKRRRSSGSKVIDFALKRAGGMAVLNTTVSTLESKAKALVKLGEMDQAIACLQCAIEAVSVERKEMFARAQSVPVTMTTVRPGEAEGQCVKRQRVSSAGESAGVTTAMAAVSGLDSMAQQEAGLYCQLASVLTSQQQFPDALHYYRLACQLHPDDMEVVFGCTRTLWEMQCQQEAVLGWLKVRDVAMTTDTEKLHSLLKSKQQLLHSLTSTIDDKGTSQREVEYTQMDISCLEELMREACTR